MLESAQAAQLGAVGDRALGDGTRASVLYATCAPSRVTDGILGSFHFDRNGDITPAKVAVLRVDGRSREGAALDTFHAGTAVEDVVEVPPRLAG